jgi:hypothetical protein
MTKYRKKPVVIEAWQVFKNDNLSTYPSWLLKEINADCIIMSDAQFLGSSLGYVRTLEGNMFIENGDYIIKDVQGEFYPCKPDIFEQTYELIKE